jgi:hypothetical protein
VIVNQNAAFIMEGGGVDVRGTFTMTGGTISGNEAERGGVKVSDKNGTFTKKGGTIYGDTDATHAADSTENTSTNNRGHAVQLDGDNAKKRDADADAGVTLYAGRVNGSWTYYDSSSGGVGDASANLWFAAFVVNFFSCCNCSYQ